MANEMHEPDGGKRSMSKQLSVNTMVCSEYEKLLEGSRRSLEIWNERRAEVLRSPLIAMEAGDELVALQAKFARAYTLLQNHVRNCNLCPSAARVEGRDSENSPKILADYEMYV
jgi:hypothetical protein